MDSLNIDGISLEDAFAQAVADLSDSPNPAPAQQVQDPAPQQSEDTSGQADVAAAAQQQQQDVEQPIRKDSPLVHRRTLPIILVGFSITNGSMKKQSTSATLWKGGLMHLLLSTTS